MRTRFFALLAFYLTFAPGLALAQNTKAALSSQITTDFPTQMVGAITPAILSGFLNNVVNSFQQYPGVNPQTGATYTFQLSDYGQLVTFNNSGSVAVTLPQTISPGTFCPWNAYVLNLGNGTVTITPGAGSTINGASTLAIVKGGSAFIVSDCTNYQVWASAITGNTIVAGGPTGSATVAPIITWNALGQLTAVSSATVTPAYTNVTSLASDTILGNNTASTANAVALTPGQLGSNLCTPARAIETSGSSSTYTTPTCNGVLASWLEIELQGGGGGGGGSGTSVAAGTAGNASSFGTLTANGGGAGTNSGVTDPAGGSCSGTLGTQQNFPGGSTGAITNGALLSTPGTAGAPSFYGGPGGAGGIGTAGTTAATNTGAGGGGAGSGATAGGAPGGGGAAGCHISAIVTFPAATYTYTIGASAAAGGPGTSGFVGGAGAAGIAIITAHWQ